jgi:3-methyladenine DNA glycosylase AlkD
MKAADMQKELVRLGDSETAIFLQRFFKTGPGEYGEGDLFRGIRVPALRKLAGDQGLTLSETEELLHSPYHEDRLLALLILVRLFTKGDEPVRKKVYSTYLKNTRFVNNWDLIDSSAPQIVGAFLFDKDRKVLERLARSRSLWERRIAVMATFHFIRRGEFDDTLKLARMLLSDREDLIHKAVGWMLREVGKKSPEAEENFLREHCARMPRVMLRYAVEKFSEPKRRRYLKGEI